MKLTRKNQVTVVFAPRKPYTLEAMRDQLLAELAVEIGRAVRRQQTGLTPGITYLLNRIQRVNEKINKRAKTTVAAILEKQDELAKKVFDLHMTKQELASDFTDVSRMIDEFRPDRYA